MKSGRLLCSVHRQAAVANSFLRQKQWRSNFSMSEIIEPPLDSPVMERPCTLVLMEDENEIQFLLDTKTSSSHSWLKAFQIQVPQNYGMSFALLATSSKKLRLALDLDNRFEAMKVFLPSIHDAVLVARGPVASLCAQYYLESFPLLGLVMVDPLPSLSDWNEGAVDDVDDENKNHGSDQSRKHNVSIQKEWRSFLDQQHHSGSKIARRPLRLEPNAVPMMVLLSEHSPLEWKKASQIVAACHSNENGIYGVVPVRDLTGPGNALQNGGASHEAKHVLELLDLWVDEIL